YKKVFLYNIKPGIVTAILFTFIPALGSYAIPKLVGGSDAQMLGNLIARELTITRNWPKAAAISTILTIITIIFILIMFRYGKEKEEI
ncbi:MAG: ABC transporter permease, partial [Psychrilyobacter sp.]|nr:ABC transporter permease [Psychrilyobacter sp.]